MRQRGSWMQVSFVCDFVKYQRNRIGKADKNINSSMIMYVLSPKSRSLYRRPYIQNQMRRRMISYHMDATLRVHPSHGGGEEIAGVNLALPPKNPKTPNRGFIIAQSFKRGPPYGGGQVHHAAHLLIEECLICPIRKPSKLFELQQHAIA